jgi:hypothetical protein
MFFLLLSGCSSAYRLEIIESTTYLEFSKGDEIKVGDVFVLYKFSKVPASGRYAPPKEVRKNVGRIRVTEIADDIHALVALLEGDLEPGLKVEKLK